MYWVHSVVTVVLLAFVACSPEEEQVTVEDDLVVRDSIVCYSLFAKPLKYPTETRASFQKKDSLLQVARQNYDSDSRSLDNIIWFGRRLAYLSEYPKAMSIYTRGLHLHPQSPELYRHRGHRYISMRRFEEAAADLALASELARGREIEIEPDGIPNKLNKPLSSLQFNIWYHLGLAYYLDGEYELAARAYDSCMVYSINDDLLCATSEWYYLTALRLGDQQKADEILRPIKKRMEIIENEAYQQLLLMYKGDLEPHDVISLDTSDVDNEHQFATVGYGVANYLKANERDAEADAIIARILNSEAWASFGYIATEADKAAGRW